MYIELKNDVYIVKTGKEFSKLPTDAVLCEFSDLRAAICFIRYANGREITTGEKRHVVSQMALYKKKQEQDQGQDQGQE